MTTVTKFSGWEDLDGKEKVEVAITFKTDHNSNY